MYKQWIIFYSTDSLGTSLSTSCSRSIVHSWRHFPGHKNNGRKAAPGLVWDPQYLGLVFMPWGYIRYSSGTGHAGASITCITLENNAHSSQCTSSGVHSEDQWWQWYISFVMSYDIVAWRTHCPNFCHCHTVFVQDTIKGMILRKLPYWIQNSKSSVDISRRSESGLAMNRAFFI